MKLKIPVILGSVRSERQGLRVALYLIEKLRERGHEPELVDPLKLKLPLLDKMYKEYEKGKAPDVLEMLSTQFRAADGFLIVSAEYNHGVPPALKNLLDHFLEEYFWRPSAIACYSAGKFGGVRAAMQWRAILSEMGMPSIPSLFPVPNVSESFSEDGRPQQPWLNNAAARFIDEFAFYAEALKRQRAEGTPY